METLKRQRKIVRTRITNLHTATEVELAKEEKNLVLLKANLLNTEAYLREVVELDKEILDIILAADPVDEQKVEKELDETEAYKLKLQILKIKLDELIYPVPVFNRSRRSDSPSSSEYGSAVSGAGVKKKNYKLPKFEIAKFGGELFEWIGWWAQFQKIDEDDELHASDKFHYLLQALVPGSKAEKVAKSYTISNENYPLAIEELKYRFGDKERLIEVYVKELILQNLPKCNCPKNSKKDLASYYDSLSTKIQCLKTLGVDMEKHALLLYPLIESSLSEDIVRIWQRHPDSCFDEEDGRDAQSRIETRFKALMKFLRKEVKGEERLRSMDSQDVPNKQNFKKSHPGPDRKTFQERKKEDEVPTVSGLHITSSSCIFCEKTHSSQNCYETKNMTSKEIMNKIAESKACSACLKPGHSSKNCKQKPRCFNCDKSHYTNLCFDLKKKTSETVSDAEEPKVSVGNNSVDPKEKKLMVMEVLVVRLDYFSLGLDWPKYPREMRVLFDTGSQQSYIREDVATEVRLVVKRETTENNVVFESEASYSRHRKIYEVPIQSLNGDVSKKLELASCKRINEHVPRVPPGPWLKELKERDIYLTDFTSDHDSIDILIGVDLLDKLMTGKIIRLRNTLTAVEYCFGWTLRGPVPYKDVTSGMTIANMNVTEYPVHKLWDLDQIGIYDHAYQTGKEEKEVLAKEQFLKTVSRDLDGRYVVSLPWVGGEQDLPTNRGVAEKRLKNATQKLKKDDKFNKYDDIFKSWMDEGFIEEVTPDQRNRTERVHYLPHRPVYKPDSLTTPVRPVFDASCKVGRFPSLNECLEKGPNLIELIPNVMLRFREGKIGVISDIRKAFQMISVREEERNYFRFLWWEGADCKEVKEYRHSRVVFGATCSPFILAAVLEYHTLSGAGDEDLKKKFLNSLYVDNCVTSFKSLKDYERFKDLSVKLLEECKMDLRQWEYAFLNDDGEPEYYPSDKHMSSVLGMIWDKTSDRIGYNPVPEIPTLMTKRSILSMQQKFFDPMGYQAPALLPPKIILQEAWLQDLDWDSELSEDLKKKCLTWVEEMQCLSEVWIPRDFTGGINDKSNWELLVFCDASLYAYAACVFLRTTEGNNNGEATSVQLLQAKARVAPRKKNKDGTIKKITIPRLELMSCVIAARLAESVRKALDLDIPTHFYGDSDNALAWIKGNDEWGTFVGNRVKEILRLTTPAQWSHVPGKENPADLPSRGCTPQELVESKWWEGPAWMKKPKEYWPIGNPMPDRDIVFSERKKMVKVVNLNTTSEGINFFPYHVYQQNVDFVIATRRFIYMWKEKKKLVPPYSVEERELAEKFIWKQVQQSNDLSVEAKKRNLQTEMDEDGVLRVKSRLSMLEDTDQFRHPILLPRSHVLVEQLVMHVHCKNNHAGVQIMMSLLRERYWIVQSRKVIQKVLKSCTRCQRFKSKSPEVPCAPLPEDRVKDAKVFEVVGFDLAGPLYFKDGKKCWIVLFTCAVYRAVHLELVSSLSTDAFLMSFFRFVSLRGRPKVIYSDNGTNFAGANNLFKELDWDRIQKDVHETKIQWNFNPPSAAWWGGWWEVLVREVKKLLLRMCGKRTLEYDELLTMLCEISSTINSRPLTYVTEDGDDLIPLTPAMFMQEMQSDPAPEWKVLESSGLRRKFRKLRQLREDLRKRFQSEYLSLLIGKGSDRRQPFKVGDIVLVGSDNKKRIEWPMAKILELIPGKDGVIRVAKVKSEKGSLIRPLQRLYPLEMTDQEKSLNPAPEVRQRAKVEKEVRQRKKEKEIVETSSLQDAESFLTNRGRRTSKPKSYGK